MNCGGEMRLICWPFDNGRRGVGMGAGALRLRNDQAFRRGIERPGWRVAFEEVEAVDERRPEVARVIELVRRLAARVRRAAEAGALPVVLAGNCNSCLGTVAGVGADRLGVVWLDAHADFDDPDDNVSGFLDVMGLAMLTGRGWSALRATIPGHVAVPERNVVLLGVRDLEPYQQARLKASEITVVPGRVDAVRLRHALQALGERVERIYLHVDLDSLDAAEGRANAHAAPGGPSLQRVLECVAMACGGLPLAAAAITAYDPTLDGDGRVLRAARRVTAEVAADARR